MSDPESSDRRASAKSNLLDRLHDPTQLRIFLTATVLLVGYAAIYTPFDSRIAATKRSLIESQKRLDLAHDVERLRKEFSPIEERLPQQSDSKEWEQYMLGEIGQFSLKLESFKPNEPRTLGPYKAVVMQLDLSGSFLELDRFLCWLESNQRLFRVDDMKLGLGAAGNLSMKVTVLGLMG